MIGEKIKQFKYKSRLWQKKHAVKIENNARINSNCVFAGNNYIGAGTYLYMVQLGKASYFGDRGTFYGAKIGKYTCIGEIGRAHV